MESPYQKKRSKSSPFKRVKKENIPYVKPLGFIRNAPQTARGADN